MQWEGRCERARENIVKLVSKSVALAAIVSSAALAGDFIDTRVVFAVANSNVFVKPGETSPSEPGTGFGAAKQNTQFCLF